MRAFQILFTHSGLLSVLLLFAHQCFGSQGRTFSANELPSPIKNAVRISSQLIESSLINDLNGATTGHIVADVQLETLQDFFIYEDSVVIEALDDPTLGGARWILTTKNSSKTQSFLDPVSKKLKKGFRGQNVFSVTAQLSSSVTSPLSPSHKLPIRIHFQACSKSECLLPVWAMLEVPTSLNVEREKESQSLMEHISHAFQKTLDHEGPLSFKIVLILFLAGLLTAFTPCVYPIYPITLGIFSRWEKTLHFPAILLAVAYCVGMTLSYASLGLFTLVTGNLFASITQTPVFLISIGTLILVSAIFFSGLLNFPMPAFFQNYVSHVGEGAEKKGSLASLLAAMAMGASLGIVASPCVGPVLVALLAWLSNAVSSGHTTPSTAFLFLAIFGAGMSFPFLVLGHLILRTKMKIQLGRFTPLVKYLGTILLCLSSLFFLIPGIQQLSSSNIETKTFSFSTFSMSTAPEKSWRVLDFRADWCAACLQLERETFSAPEVAAQFEHGAWNYVQIDFTNMSDDNQKIAEQFKVLSLPTVLLMNPENKICEDFSLHSFEQAHSFLARLKEAELRCK